MDAPIDVPALAALVAVHLPGFTVHTKGEPNVNNAELRHPDGRGLWFYVANYPKSAQGKVEVSGQFGALYEHRLYSDATHKIKVAISRGALVIAREINRRLLDDYTQQFNERSARAAVAASYREQRLATLTAVAEAFGEQVDLTDRYGNPREVTTVRLGERYGYGEIQANGTTVKLELGTVTVEQARKIAKLFEAPHAHV